MGVAEGVDRPRGHDVRRGQTQGLAGVRLGLRSVQLQAGMVAWDRLEVKRLYRSTARREMRLQYPMPTPQMSTFFFRIFHADISASMSELCEISLQGPPDKACKTLSFRPDFSVCHKTAVSDNLGCPQPGAHAVAR